MTGLVPKPIVSRDETGKVIASTEPRSDVGQAIEGRMLTAIAEGRLVDADETERVKDELLLWARKQVARHLRFTRDWQAMERGELDHWLMPELRKLETVCPDYNRCSICEQRNLSGEA